jgi:hypothetical protein
MRKIWAFRKFRICQDLIFNRINSSLNYKKFRLWNKFECYNSSRFKHMLPSSGKMMSDLFWAGNTLFYKGWMPRIIPDMSNDSLQSGTPSVTKRQCHEMDFWSLNPLHYLCLARILNCFVLIQIGWDRRRFHSFGHYENAQRLIFSKSHAKKCKIIWRFFSLVYSK